MSEATKYTLITLVIAFALTLIGYFLFIYCTGALCIPEILSERQIAPAKSGTSINTVDNTSREEIVVSAPQPNMKVKSPLIISGKVRGYWMFEASMPGMLLDDKENLIKQFPLTTSDNWMTTDFVNFHAEIAFNKPNAPSGFLVIKNDNPSGLPEKEKMIKIPIQF